MLALLGPVDPALLAVLPRGDLYFYSSFKLILVVGIFLGWVRTIAWIDQDAEKTGVSRELWNLICFSACAAGLFLFVLLPYFGMAFFMAVLFYLSSTLVYISQRNHRVPRQLRLFTGKHLMGFFKNLFSGSGKKNEAEEEAKGIPIRFLARDRKKGEEAEEVHIKSPGLQAAVELLWDALQSRATDIHLEPSRDEMIVRFRVDSMMQPAQPFPRQRGDAILNIFKNLAGLDITEKRKPQDGSFTAEVDKRNVDFRVATAGSVNGEKMVMRILDSARQMKGLSQTGLRESMRQKIQEMIQQSNGMLITCGPTGAGKTSTLYSCLKEIDRFQRNVITLENPVEYHVENITQIEVNDKAGKTFANELRSVLRQDPDVILIGEIRDAETAEIACQSAQTGHIVLTTMHANDTVTALTRLIDLGVKPFMIAGALTAVLGQRLVRVLCPHCKVACPPPPDLLKKFRVTTDKIKAIYRAPEADDRPGDDDEEDPRTCKHCKGAGYIGRTGIFELLILNDELRALLRSSELDITAIKQAALKSGLITLYDEGLRKVLEGKTSLAELQRVAK